MQILVILDRRLENPIVSSYGDILSRRKPFTNAISRYKVANELWKIRVNVSDVLIDRML